MLHLVLHFIYLTAVGKAGIYEQPNAFFHLTLEEQCLIFTGSVNGSTKAAIALTIGKDKSAVGKEIKLHRTLTHKRKMPLECSNYRKYPFNCQCTPPYPEYIPFHCSRRDHSPSACNDRSYWSHCRFDKYQSCPEDAHMNYRTMLIVSREGVNLTSLEAKAMADIIKPLLKQGDLPFQITTTHPRLSISEKILYNYIKNDIFHEIAGITVLDLRR